MRRFSGELYRFCATFLFLFLCVSASLSEIKAQSLPPTTEAKIRAVLNSPQLKGAHVGLSILDLGSVKNAQFFPSKAPIGKPFRVLFERDADKKFMPASNVKLFTAAIALELLGKDKTFPTRVVTEIGFNFQELRLKLIGGGNPALSHEDLDELAKLVAPRLDRRPLAIIGDGTAFSAETFGGDYPFGWIIDDTQWYYGPQINALAIDRNQLDITITGGDGPGMLPKVEINPSPIPFVLLNQIITDKPQEKVSSFEEAIGWKWLLHPVTGELTLLLEGKVASRQVFSQGISLPESAPLAAAYLQKSLSRLTVSGSDGSTAKIRPPFTQSEEVAVHNSPSLKTLFLRLLKNSDNLYAEMLLRDAAYYHDGTGGDKAGPRAHALLKKWLISQNIDTSGLRFEDGSGLSRYNLLTPRATAELLAAINRMQEGDVIWNALPIAGMDGTLKKRLRSTPALGNVRAKTGTFSIASNLSGYVTTRNNRRLAVAIFINFARNPQAAQKAQDEIFGILAASTLPTRSDAMRVKVAFDEP